jgi:aspartyl-tRNA(Asn)/glutamyl-tRNA(Gln) amidotransferase subunit A
VTPLAASFDTVGPLAASVSDAALAYSVMAGHDPADPWSLPEPVRSPGRLPDLRGLRLGIPRGWIDRPLSADVADGWTAFLDMLRTAGVELVELHLASWEFPGLVTEAMYPEVAAAHRRRFETAPEHYGPEVRERIALALEADMDGYLRGLAWRRRLGVEVEQALETCDALVTPSVAALRKTIGVDTIAFGGESIGYRLALSCFSALVNQSGRPALAVPVAIPGSPPPSVQLIGASWSEHRLLALGMALEDAGIVAVPGPPAPA